MAYFNLFSGFEVGRVQASGGGGRRAGPRKGGSAVPRSGVVGGGPCAFPLDERT